MQDSDLQNLLYPNSTEIARTILKGAADLLKTEAHNSNFLDFIKALHESQIARKEAMIILKGHIRNLNFNETWTMLLEILPAGSPSSSLQTVSDNIKNLTKTNKSLPKYGKR